MNIKFIACYAVLLLLSGCASTQQQAQSAFIDTMVTTHHFDKTALNRVFEQVVIKDDILKAIASPSEAMPWYKYQKIFLTETRINQGVTFWRDHRQVLAEVEQHYGVPAEIIVAIIGVETRYGQHQGKHRIIDALATLAFAYPPRSKFFRSELEQYLLLCRDEALNPLTPKGSYAGAMGIPQFMPSSFRRYAVDFDHDGRRDIWQNSTDTIASVANYFVKHQWQTGQDIIVPVTAQGANTHSAAYQSALNSANLKPNLRLADLELLNLKTSRSLPFNAKVKLLSFEQQPQGEELWAALDNFYVITRYNHSPLYALAVYQLSQAILKTKGPFP